MFRSFCGYRFAAVTLSLLFAVFGPVATATAAPPKPLVTAQAPAAALSEKLILSFASAAAKILDVREKYLPKIKSAPNEAEASKIFTRAQTEMRAIL